ncbi:hypothetical protein HYR99_04395 [Candidatus Poribacteria bacterium]|nr:hypothetical protein [Candidatus Poribacteria bacterium]
MLDLTRSASSIRCISGSSLT